MLKLLSLFSGIGAFEKALDNLEVPYDLIAFCEFDKYAVKSYCAIHDVDESKNLGDITKVDETKLPKDLDILTYGFPCQDISLAGKQKGLFNEDGTQTRSGLFFEALRIIEHTQPKIAIAENVKNLVSKKFNAQFQVVLASLDSVGYNSYYAVLNAKDFGVPQNRERVFIVSIRKDIDTGKFEFPKTFPLKRRLKDVLEEVVDEKYYLSDKMIEYFTTITEKNKANGNGNVYVPTDPEGVSKTITTKEGQRVKDNFIEEPQLQQIGQLYPNGGNPQAGRVYDADGISPTMDTCSGGNRMPKVAVEPVHLGNIYGEHCGTGYAGNVWDKDAISPTLMTMQGGNRQPFIVVDGDVVKVREATKQGYAEAHEGDSINIEQPNSTTRRGRVGKQMAQTLNTTAFMQAAVVNEPQSKNNPWVSEKGVRFILSPKRGMCTDINPDVIQPLTAKGQQNWTGSFVSPDIETLEKSTTIGSTEPVKIRLKNGETITSDDDTSHLRIRKLTPKECFRLMGFDDESFHKAEAVNSNTQLYKQAGNSIVVDVLEELFCMMLDEDGNLYV